MYLTISGHENLKQKCQNINLLSSNNHSGHGSHILKITSFITQKLKESSGSKDEKKKQQKVSELEREKSRKAAIIEKHKEAIRQASLNDQKIGQIQPVKRIAKPLNNAEAMAIADALKEKAKLALQMPTKFSEKKKKRPKDKIERVNEMKKSMDPDDIPMHLRDGYKPVENWQILKLKP